MGKVQQASIYLFEHNDDPIRSKCTCPAVEAAQIYPHEWQQHDTVAWDQRRLMHMEPPVEVRNALFALS